MWLKEQMPEQSVLEFTPIEILPSYKTTWTLSNQEVVDLYLAKAKCPKALGTRLPSLPEILRKMPKDGSRMPIVRAWQVFAGAMAEETSAVVGEQFTQVMDSIRDNLKQ